MSGWFNSLQKAKKSCMIQGNLKKVHYLFENGQEMVEEYNTDTKCLTRRAWKMKSELGDLDDEWDIEVGDPEPKVLKKDQLIIENSNQPFITRRTTRINLEWRIRNLPYSIETYSVTADTVNKCITVRTTNKKYYKQITIPELNRINLLPQQDMIQITHKYNTLVISYKKPKELLDLEKVVYDEIVMNIQPNNDPQIGDCKPS